MPLHDFATELQRKGCTFAGGKRKKNSANHLKIINKNINKNITL